MIQDFTFHHTGIIVRSINEVSESYKSLFGDDCLSEIIYISSQKVNVCFVNLNNGSFLELVEANEEDSTISRLVKKGTSYYHTAYLTYDIEKAVDYLTSKNYRALQFFSSEAFNGKRCIFLFSPDALLIELIEK